MPKVCIQSGAFSHDREISDFVANLQDAGGVVSFLGLVRTDGVTSKDPVMALELFDHPRLTAPQVAARVDKVITAWKLEDALVVHRVGRFLPTEPIVLVAAASAHRRSAFEAADALMDWLKTEAMFWKREWRRSGATWIDPRAEDYADAERWRGN